MRVRRSFQLPEDKERDRRRMIRLEWITIAAMLSIVVLLYFVLGSSQAMRTAWIEDILSLIPPIAILIAARVEERAPDRQFPYGYYRAVSLAFALSSVALVGVGLFLLYESVMKLALQEHPTIGTVVVFGQQLWLGWLMIGALLYSVVLPVILGRLKQPLAQRLHDKALYADARMDRADWVTGLAAIVGVLGIAVGWWWADAVAAAGISLSVLRDGWTNLKQAALDLMDHAPTTIADHQRVALPARLREAVRSLDWVEDAEVRLREEGHLYTGEVFVVPREDAYLTARMQRANEELMRNDWRLYELSWVPVLSLEAAETHVEDRPDAPPRPPRRAREETHALGSA